LKDLHDACGVFGIFGHEDAATMTCLGLHALQHRGQESAGIVTSDGHTLHEYRQMGLVADVFTSDVLKRLNGHLAIGHVRYSTAGSSSLVNAQPMTCVFSGGMLALAHNGNIPGFASIKSSLIERGQVFHSQSDSEVLLHLIAESRASGMVGCVVDLVKRIPGAYSIVVLTPRELIAARDPYGFRPLVMGRLDSATVIASETASLDLIGATYEREVEPGEVVAVGPDGVTSHVVGVRPVPARCVFEHVYFARTDSIVFGRNVYRSRRELGRQLARERGVPSADVVVPVPDSGVVAALGYAEEAGLPFEMGLIRSHYMGRTFIEPESRIRHLGVRLKLNPVHELIEGRVVVVVDDSIVRGTTARQIVETVRSAGAREVHLRIASPPTRWPCYYGIDTPVREELVAARLKDEREIARSLTADSVGYLSLSGMHRAVCGDPEGTGYCDACFTGRYPVL